MERLVCVFAMLVIGLIVGHEALPREWLVVVAVSGVPIGLYLGIWTAVRAIQDETEKHVKQKYG